MQEKSHHFSIAMVGVSITLKQQLFICLNGKPFMVKENFAKPQECGNAKIWRGGLSIGAVWSMGHSITDFLNNTKLKNNYIKLANATDGGDGGDGGDINGGSVTLQSTIAVTKFV